jgi:hypothetical protein
VTVTVTVTIPGDSRPRIIQEGKKVRTRMALSGHKSQREGGDEHTASGAAAAIDAGADRLPDSSVIKSMQAGFVELGSSDFS